MEEEIGPTPSSSPFEQDEEELGPTPSSPSFLRAVTSYGPTPPSPPPFLRAVTSYGSPNAREAGQEPDADLDALLCAQRATNTAGGGGLSTSFTGGLNPFIRCLRPVNTRLRPGDLDEDADLRLPPSSLPSPSLLHQQQPLRPVNTRLRPGDLDEDADLRLPPSPPPPHHLPLKREDQQAGVQHQQPPTQDCSLSGTTMPPCLLPAAAAAASLHVRRPPSLLVGTSLPYLGSGAGSLGGGGVRRSAVGEQYLRPNHWPDTLQVGAPSHCT